MYVYIFQLHICVTGVFGKTVQWDPFEKANLTTVFNMDVSTSYFFRIAHNVKRQKLVSRANKLIQNLHMGERGESFCSCSTMDSLR